VEGSINGRKNAFKKLGEKFVKITYKVENEDIVVITALIKGD